LLRRARRLFKNELPLPWREGIKGRGFRTDQAFARDGYSPQDDIYGVPRMRTDL
jgi:hypothetical protein